MGFRLFMAGIWGQSGELTAEFRETRVILKKAAPGTFFALFGTAIIVATLWKGLEIERYTGGEPIREEVEKKSSAWEKVELMSQK